MMFPSSCTWRSRKIKKEYSCSVKQLAYRNGARVQQVQQQEQDAGTQQVHKRACTKLMLRRKRTFFSSSNSILIVVRFSRRISWLVSPRLLTSSMFRKDSVVDPASIVVSFTIVLLYYLDLLAQHIHQYAQQDTAAKVYKHQ